MEGGWSLLIRMLKVGIICEDPSDYDAISQLVRRVSKKDRMSFEKFAPKGCAKMMNKMSSYAETLSVKRCTALIVVHDMDRNSKENLIRSITSKIQGCSIRKKLICIPVEELEAWFLSDMTNIKNVFSLQKKPKDIPNPENVNSPKEHLEKIVKSHSDKRKVSLSTLVNKKIAENVDLDLIRKKCPSFNDFYEFTSVLN